MILIIVERGITNMKTYLNLIKKYTNLFLSLLGLVYLLQELLNWFEGDSPINVAFIVTSSLILGHLSIPSFKKFNKKKG